VFTDEEQVQLRTVLALDESGLRLVLEGCSYVLEQAAYNGASDGALATELAEAGMSLSQVRSSVPVRLVFCAFPRTARRPSALCPIDYAFVVNRLRLFRRYGLRMAEHWS
jgi:hypothetical protein